MILDSLTLENFGVYGGTQTVELTPVDADHPIILFGGLNGGGKTTLLDAIQLVLYGPRAHLSNRSRSYQKSLHEAIHRGVEPEEGASIELSFRRVIEGRYKKYTVRRAWSLGEKGINERLSVSLDDQYDLHTSEHWDELIEGYIPSGISHLFFFDAEQITELAEGERAAELLGTAISSLLGLGVVDQLESDLGVLERRKRGEGKSTEETRRLSGQDAEIGRLEVLVGSAIQEQGRLTNEVERRAQEVARSEALFRHHGGDFYVRRGEIDIQLAELHKKIEGHENILRELASGAAPLLLLNDLLADTEVEIRRAGEIRRNHVLVGALEARDTDILTALSDRQFPSELMDTIAAVLVEDRKARAASLSLATPIEVDEHLASEIRHLRGTVLPESAVKIRSELEAADQLQEQLVRTEAARERVPEEDAILKLQQDLSHWQLALAAKRAEFQVHEALKDTLIRDLERARAAFRQEAQSHAETMIKDEQRSRVLKHSAKVRATLQKFRREIVSRHTARIEKLMLESFVQLLRKTSLVSNLHIDPVTFMIELTGGDGKPLPFNRLSAGERQLLATSLLWGLAKVSGRPLPTIIDTPLGRLDSSHRQHLLERYFPVASHQVILLSTDEEITEANLSRIAPYIGRTYRLVHDDQRRSTIIEQGYFWNRETTS